MIKKVLVTGGLGYLGGRIVQSLVNSGYTVFCGSRRASSALPVGFPQIQMLHLDWETPEALEVACSGMDAVVHLAAINEINAANDPIGALQMNGVASLRLLEAAISVGVSRFVYFSTAHVYGAPLQGEICETTLTRPQHPYAITHRVTEDFVLAAHDKRRIEGIVFRLSNGFGAPATHDVNRWTLLVNDLCRQAASTGQLTLQTTGEQLRDFITLEDVSRAVVHILSLESQKLSDGLFNLGGDATMSIFSMAQHVVARWKVITGRELPVERPTPTGVPPPLLHYSCEKLKKSGFVLTSNMNREIDATLRMCITAFGK